MESPTSPVEKIFHRISKLKKSMSKHDVVKITANVEINDTEIPPKPCSVVQINDHIKANELNQAYVNLLSLRLELQQEREALGEIASDVDLNNKETDISMLFETLRSKMTNIVRSSTLPSVKKELLAQVATIILEEEKKPETGLEGWRKEWKNAVRDGVKDTVKKVPLDKPEQKTSWIAVHLGLLGKVVEDDLEIVKAEILSLYPPDFNVFETYVSCYREVVEEHLKGLLEKVTESKDYHAVLDFIVHRCPSDLRKEQSVLKLETEFLNKIKNAYHHQLMEDFKAALKNIINIESNDVWKIKKKPDRTDDGFLTSHIHMDICQLIASYAVNLNEIDDLRNSVVRFSLEELHQFHIRFEEEFRQNTRSLLSSDLLDSCLWVEYHITYINTFNSLKEQVQCYKESCSAQVEKLERDVNGLTRRLRQTLMDHFKTDIKPYINGMMTKKWLKTDEDFTEVTSRIENYSGFCKSMRNPAAQIFVNDVHYYVMKEYVSQLMKKKFSCKNTKNEEAAVKIRAQCEELRKLFDEMGSSLDWLYPLGNYLSDIIGMKNEKDIKDILRLLVRDYPDISKKQISAVLCFRNNGFSFERHRVINQIKQDTGNINHERTFFLDMESDLSLQNCCFINHNWD